jgi:hypothetical protein
MVTARAVRHNGGSRRLVRAKEPFMAQSTVPRRPAYTDIPPSKRHDGSIEGYRRQRRLALQRRLASEALVPVRETGRTQ